LNTELVRFIEKNNLGYLLGNTIRVIVFSRDESLSEQQRLQHLKDARAFINVEIKNLSKKEKTK
jgi:cell division protein FtsB